MQECVCVCMYTYCISLTYNISICVCLKYICGNLHKLAKLRHLSVCLPYVCVGNLRTGRLWRHVSMGNNISLLSLFLHSFILFSLLVPPSSALLISLRYGSQWHFFSLLCTDQSSPSLLSLVLATLTPTLHSFHAHNALTGCL